MCQAAQCCSDVVHGKCAGNTHSDADTPLAVTATGTATTGTTCTACGTGKFSTASNVATCTDHATTATCGAGLELVAGTSTTDVACTACATGKFSALDDALACADLTATGTCANAGEGWIVPTTAVNADSACGDCPAGKYAATSDNTCIDCAAGFKTDTGTAVKGTTCTACGTGKFS